MEDSPRLGSGFDIDFEREGVTLPATDLRFGDILPGFLTIRSDLHPSLKDGRERTAHRGIQAQMFTGIGTRNAGHRTGLAQIRRPVLTRDFQQAAFLRISAAKIIAIKVRALCARWSFHVLLLVS